MRTLVAITALLALALPHAVLAEAKRPLLKVTETVEVKAAPRTVWNLIKNFNGLQNWHPAFSNAQIKRGKNNTVGAVRTLTMADGGAKFDEELLAFNDRKMSLKYRIVGDSPFPISDYAATYSVKKGKNGTAVVTWTGRFKRKVADNPPEGQDDAGVKKMISGAYRAGLDNLATVLKVN